MAAIGNGRLRSFSVPQSILPRGLDFDRVCTAGRYQMSPAWFVLAVAALLEGPLGLAQSPSDSQSLDGSTRADWLSYGGSQAALRFSALGHIKASNVSTLGP